MVLLFCLPCVAGETAVPPLGDAELLAAGIRVESSAGQAGAAGLRQPRRTGLARYNPFGLALAGLMHVYQRVISPQLPSECLYEHSCSAFSITLIGEYGVTKGVISTADRLMRCNRIAALDVHPLTIGEASGKVQEPAAIYKMKSK